MYFKQEPALRTHIRFAHVYYQVMSEAGTSADTDPSISEDADKPISLDNKVTSS